MVDLRNWRTDIKINFPRIHLLRPQATKIIAEEIVSGLLKCNFWTGFIGWWTIYQWIKHYLEG